LMSKRRPTPVNLARLADEVARDVEIESDGGSGGGVANIVNAGRMKEAEKAEVFAFVGEAEFAAEALVLDIAEMIRSAWVETP